MRSIFARDNKDNARVLMAAFSLIALIAVNTLMPLVLQLSLKFVRFNSVTNLLAEINWWVLPVYVDMWISPKNGMFA